MCSSILNVTLKQNNKIPPSSGLQAALNHLLLVNKSLKSSVHDKCTDYYMQKMERLDTTYNGGMDSADDGIC